MFMNSKQHDTWCGFKFIVSFTFDPWFYWRNEAGFGHVNADVETLDGFLQQSRFSSTALEEGKDFCLRHRRCS